MLTALILQVSNYLPWKRPYVVQRAGASSYSWYDATPCHPEMGGVFDVAPDEGLETTSAAYKSVNARLHLTGPHNALGTFTPHNSA